MAADDKRERIIESALKLFERLGYHNTKVSNIVKEAGMAQGTFYLYFKSKEDLFRSVAESCLEEIAMALAARPPAEQACDRPGGFLYITIHRSLQIYYDNRMILNILKRHGAASPEIEDISRQFYGKICGLIQATFAYYQAYPGYTEEELEMTAYAKIAMVEMVAYQWFIEKGEGPERIDDLAKVLVGVNINGRPDAGVRVI